MDEKSGMNFSEYVAILSGNTDLLDKAKIEKQIAGLKVKSKRLTAPSQVLNTNTILQKCFKVQNPELTV